MRRALVLFATLLSFEMLPSASTFAVGTSRCDASGHVPRLGARPILFFGDSITYGQGASRSCVTATHPQPGARDTSYPGEVQRALKVGVLDYGIPGERTGQGAARLPDVLRTTHPSTVVVLEGVNDLIAQMPVSDVFRRLRGMILLVQKTGAHPVLGTLTPSAYPHGLPDAIRELNARIRAFGRRQHVPVSHFGAAVTTDELVDGLHPDDAGYAAMARVVVPLLRSRQPGGGAPAGPGTASHPQ